MIYHRGFTGIINFCLISSFLKMASSYNSSSSGSNYGLTKEYPDTLQGFGYGFNKDGKLRKIIPGTNDLGEEGFEFNVSSDPEENQRRYEALGQVITKYVYELLETEGQLQKLDVPAENDVKNTNQVRDKLKSFIFASKDALTNSERLLVLIHGSGAVRAGQWARSLIINDCLKTGSQLPYIHRARELGYAIMVLNTNDNVRNIDGKSMYIKHSKEPVEHAQYVWEHYVRNARAQHIAVVAHSYGGVVTVELANQCADFRKRVCAVALTDSVHSIHRVSSKTSYYLKKVGRNWVSSSKTLDTSLETTSRDISRVSAGVEKHELTSAAALESVFDFLEQRYNSVSDMHEL